MKTIAECNVRLAELELQISDIQREKGELFRTIHYHERHNPPEPELLSKHLLWIIENHPGLNLPDIHAKLNWSHTQRQISQHLAYLRRVVNKIENRGGRGVGAHWYIREV